MDEDIEVGLHSSGVDRLEERIGFARRFAEINPVGQRFDRGFRRSRRFGAELRSRSKVFVLSR
jgi:hypothetical protein